MPRNRNLFAACSAAALILVGGSGAQAGSTTYTYDELGRVTSATDSDGTTISYSYDPTGNRTQKVTVGGTEHPPVAAADAVSTPMSTTIDFDPRSNDSDPDGDTLTILSVGAATHGTPSVQASGTRLRFIPTAGYTGSDSFSYTISDGRGQTATATVTMTMTAANHSPVATADGISPTLNTAITFDPRTNDTDADGDSLTITAVGTAGHGTTAFTATSVTYTPATGYTGSDSFGYTISDGHGGSASGTVTVTVSGGNHAPVANDDILFNSSTYGGSPYYPSFNFNPRTNDSDADGDTLTITGVTNGAHGTVTITGAGVTYTSSVLVSGARNLADSFTYTISDGHGATATATVSVDIEIDNGN